MTKYFAQDTPQASLERMMMSVPGFQRRGGGISLSSFHYKPEDVDCQYCLHYRCKSCQVPTCPYIAERLASGALEYRDLILECLGRNLRLRLYQRIKAVTHWDGLDQTILHKIRPYCQRAADKPKEDTPSVYWASLYLLASREPLWKTAVPALASGYIDFPCISCRGLAVRDYPIFYSAKRLYREKHGGAYSSGNYVQKKTPELLEKETFDGVFRIWLENPCPVRVQSETAQITLPATFEQLESARQLLGVDSLNMAKLVRAEALRPYLGEYLPLQGMDLRLEQLDELAENIRIMDQEDGALLKYLSVLEAERPETLQEALRFSIELDDYERVPDDPEEYGKQVLEQFGADEELISTLDGFTDFEALGNFYMQEDGVRRTDFGLVKRLSEPFASQEDGPAMAL